MKKVWWLIIWWTKIIIWWVWHFSDDFITCRGLLGQIHIHKQMSQHSLARNPNRRRRPTTTFHGIWVSLRCFNITDCPSSVVRPLLGPLSLLDRLFRKVQMRNRRLWLWPNILQWCWCKSTSIPSGVNPSNQRRTRFLRC